jgi:DNA-binding GntR family transcriptional regulator
MAARPGTAVGDIYLAVRERIITGDYPPGFRLSQQQLAEELSVSRTPLREALQKLQAEGLVIGHANRGMEVAPAALSDVENSYALRLMVEPVTVSAIVSRVADVDIEQMEQALADMERRSITTREFQEAHWCYHRALLDRYPDALASLIRDLHTKLYRHQRVYFSRPPALADFTMLDRVYLDALRQHDGQMAKQVLEFHLLDAALGLVRELDPEYSFDALAITLDGLEIEVDGLAQQENGKPASMRWRRAGAVVLPDLETANLRYIGSTTDR